MKSHLDLFMEKLVSLKGAIPTDPDLDTHPSSSSSSPFPTGESRFDFWSLIKNP